MTAASLPSPALDRHLPDAVLDRVPAGVVVLLGAWASIAFSVGQWHAMEVPSWDLAIFSEAAKAYSHGQVPIVPIKGDGFNILGDHFHPILVLLGPLWRLFPSPLTLLIVQDLLLAVSAWPLTRLATRVLSRWPAFLLGLAYVLSWGFQGAVSAQFHEIACAVPLLAWASVAFVDRRWWPCVLWLTPVVLVKEDLGLTLVMAGLAIVLRGHHDIAMVDPQAAWVRHAPARVRELRARAGHVRVLHLGLGLAVFGLVAFLVTVLVILPALSPSGTWEYGIGGNAGDGSASAASSGNLLVRLFSPGVKIATLFMLACTAGLIGLRSPWIMLVLPTIAWRFLSTKEFYWDWRYWHYNAILMPIALGALLDVLVRIKARHTHRFQQRAAQLAAYQKALGVPGTEEVTEADEAPSSGPAPVKPHSAEARTPAAGWLAAPVGVRWLVMVSVAVPVLTAWYTAPDLAFWAMTADGYGSRPERAEAAAQVISTIPQDATVETDLGLLAYLVPSSTVSWVGTSQSDTDYVVIDSLSSAWGGNPPTDAAQWATSQSPEGSTYELVLDVDGYQVAKRRG